MEKTAADPMVTTKRSHPSRGTVREEPEIVPVVVALAEDAAADLIPLLGVCLEEDDEKILLPMTPAM